MRSARRQAGVGERGAGERVGAGLSSGAVRGFEPGRGDTMQRECVSFI